jgi:hypothetical protein
MIFQYHFGAVTLFAALCSRAALIPSANRNGGGAAFLRPTGGADTPRKPLTSSSDGLTRLPSGRRRVSINLFEGGATHTQTSVVTNGHPLWGSACLSLRRECRFSTFVTAPVAPPSH